LSDENDRQRSEEGARRAEEAARRAEEAAREAEEIAKEGGPGPGEDETYAHGRDDDEYRSEAHEPEELGA
jgi:hypothetical protein